jgi:hypothetical protein
MLENVPIGPGSPGAMEEFLKQREHVKFVARGGSREVCVCGHAMGHHSTLPNGRTACTPGNTRCKCHNPRAVLKVENLRMFMYTTTGVGIEHALGKGMMASLSRKFSYVWIEDPLKCDWCSFPAEDPISISLKDGYISDSSEFDNKIVCRECVGKISSKE